MFYIRLEQQYYVALLAQGLHRECYESQLANPNIFKLPPPVGSRGPDFCPGFGFKCRWVERGKYTATN
jgi:hypothetical protein